MSPPRSLASSVTAQAAIGRRIFPGILAALVLAACAKPATADEKQPPKASVRTLQGDDAQQVESLTQTIDRLKSAGQFAEAVEPARKVLAICQKALGPDHWQTADARRLARGRPQGDGVGGRSRPEGRCGASARPLRRIGTNQPDPAGDSPEMVGGGPS